MSKRDRPGGAYWISPQHYESNPNFIKDELSVLRNDIAVLREKVKKLEQILHAFLEMKQIRVEEQGSVIILHPIPPKFD